MNKVFVYGTLMSGKGNNKFLMNSKYIGVATLEDYRLFDLRGISFPAITEFPKYSVVGEVWEIDAETEKHLDYLEGLESGMYTKTSVEVKIEHQDELTKAIAYTVTEDNGLLYKRLNFETEYDNKFWEYRG